LDYAANHHRKGAEDRRAGGFKRGRDRVFDDRAAPHFVANSGDGVNPVVDTETDPERNHRDGVNRQSDVTRVHVHEGAEVRHHARYDKEQSFVRSKSALDSIRAAHLVFP
jgi:hypothetical protein